MVSLMRSSPTPWSPGRAWLVVLVSAAACVQSCAWSVPEPRYAPLVTPEAPPAPPAADEAPATTGGGIELSRVTVDPLAEFWPRPSPDGRRLLLHTVDGTKSGPARFSIVKLEVGASARDLVTGTASSEPAWCPDGASFVYQLSTSLPPRIVRSSVGTVGTGIVFVTGAACGEWDDEPDVSASDSRIAFSTKLGGAAVIATVGMDGSNLTVHCPGSGPRWSPDGSRLVFQRVVGDKSQVFVLALKAGGQVTQLTTGDANNRSPAWSPDGEWLTLTSDRDGAEHVYVVRADGSRLTQLTRGATQDLQPSWSKDGFVYFASNAGGNWDIWRVKPVLQ